jgi:anaerobic ribonucleoside-triphosphate reductase
MIGKSKDKVVKFNKCAYFLLPLVGLDTRSYGEEALEECYVTRNKEMVLKLKMEKVEELIASENHKNMWEDSGYTWMVYNIPFEYLDEYDAFLDGKYSAFSEKAYQTILNSMAVEKVKIDEKAPDHKRKIAGWKDYAEKIHEARHPKRIFVEYTNSKSEISPMYLNAIAPMNSDKREGLRQVYSNDFGFDLPESFELYEKPDLEKEVIELEDILA